MFKSKKSFSQMESVCVFKLGLRSFTKASHRQGNQISIGTFRKFETGFR